MEEGEISVWIDTPWRWVQHHHHHHPPPPGALQGRTL